MPGGPRNDRVLAPAALKQRCARAETRIEDKYSALVMIRTNPHRPKQSPRRSASMGFVRLSSVRLAKDRSAHRPGLAPSGLPPLGSESGDTLIEVVISAALISLVVIAVLFGLDSTNRATAKSRARSQADALAQQDEERLRGEPIKKLDKLSRKETVTVGATTYTITTTAEYHSDATGTASCSSSVPTADYLQTVSTVTWPSGPSEGVVETGVISPPADSALIVRVEDAGSPLAGAKVVARGPAPSISAQELETSLNGCAILALSPGEYTINVSKAGYVDENGYPNTENDLSVTKKVYLPAETTSKEGYHLGLAGKLQVTFTEAGKTIPPPVGDSVVYFNSGMAHPEIYPNPSTLETYSHELEAGDIYPISSTTKYAVYAGTCEADLPTRYGQGPPPEVGVAPGENVPVSVPLAPIDIKVLESKGLPEKPVNNATVVLEDTGCKAVRKLATTPEGKLSHPGMPFGTYSLCVTATVGGKQREDTVPIENDNATGTPLQTIYLSEEGKEGSVC